MKILITTHTYLPNKDGVQFVNQYLAEGLVKRGHQVTVLTYCYPSRTRVPREVINGVRVIRWNARTSCTFHKGEKLAYQNFILNSQSDYDVLVNVGTQTALTDWLFPIFSQLTIPKVLYIHSIWDFNWLHWHRQSFKRFVAKAWANVRWKYYYWTKASIFKQYHEVIQLHPKDYSVAFFKEKYGIESQILENAADASFFQNRNAVKKQSYIVNVSNFNDRKNQKKAVEYFLKSNLPNEWKLVLVGSEKNQYLQSLQTFEKELRNQLGITSGKEIEYRIGLSREEVVKTVKEASFCLMTSIWEAFPISLIEVMAAGIPFISSDVGIVNYLSGGITACSDQEFIRAIEEFASCPEIRNQYGKKGQMEAKEHYQVDDKVKELEALLQKIVKEEKE